MVLNNKIIGIEMNINKALIILGTVTLVTACAGNPNKSDGKIASDSGKVCRYEKTTGSNIGTKICRTPAQMEAERAAAKRALENLQRGQTNTSN